MSKYNKMIGTIVGALLGGGLIAIGVSVDGTVPEAWAPVVQFLQVTIMGALGTYLAKPNA